MKILYKEAYVHKKMFCPNCGKFLGYDVRPKPKKCTKCDTVLE